MGTSDGNGGSGMKGRRRVDHVGILVQDTNKALAHFSGRIGLPVIGQEELEHPRVRLTYLDAGNICLQLVEPLDSDSDAARALIERGEGLHHLGFAVEDVDAAARSISIEPDLEPQLVQGSGRVSAFVRGPQLHGVTLEVTAIDAPLTRAVDLPQPLLGGG
jgi:methylmalonyl-CoA/ethylmalonyl-CoA epimerase